MGCRHALVLISLCAFVACGTDLSTADPNPQGITRPAGDAPQAGGDSVRGDESPGDGGVGDAGTGGDSSPPPPKPILVVTFNTGTTDGLGHDDDTSDGYTSAQAEISDDWYGNGVAWLAAIEGTTQFFADLRPDIVAFQELFFSGACEDIPEAFHAGFACETWSPGDPSVVELLLGPEYQVACHLSKPDKCIGVHQDFGTLAGCDDHLCLDGLDGMRIDDCGGGSRIGRGVVDLVDGGFLTVVNVHGTSGFKLEDQMCRYQQVNQVFVNMDGAPAANGSANIILGDFNTDPGRASGVDASAARWRHFTGDGDRFQFITDVGNDAIPTYETFNIDHVLSDRFEGECWHPGITVGAPLLGFTYFDHVPAVCSLHTLP